MTSRLENNIKELYETFEKYQGNSAMDGSPNYDDLEIWNKELFSKPLRELDEDDLSRFTGKAITTWGSANDYKHFLPRIFELIAELRTPYEISIAFDKLTLAEWTDWNESEQKVIQEFMIALWESILNENSEKAEWEFKDYFSTIAHFYTDFTDLLEIWQMSESKGAIKHLANYIVDDSYFLFNKGKMFEFGEIIEKPEKRSEFTNWLLSDLTLNRLQQKYFEYESEEFAEKISWAEKIISTERKNTVTNTP